MDFSDRFIRQYSILGNSLTTLNNLTDAQLKAQYPDLASCIDAVKRHSVLLTKKSYLDIYYAIIDHADPKIGLVLAAARDNSGNQLFGSTEIVKEFMFGATTDQRQKSDVTFRDHYVFIDGIRRVATSLAASLLIGQLAQIAEQQKHSEYLEKQALQDLDRILQVPTLRDVLAKEKTEIKDNIKSFYFEPKVCKLTNDVRVEVFLSGNNTWSLVNVYPASSDLNTATLSADISDVVNSLTLNSTSSNLLAAPIMAGLENLHQIEFRSRQRDLVIYTELVSVRIREAVTNKNIITPFVWGIDPIALKDYSTNSLLLAVESGKVTSLGTTGTNTDLELNTLYFRQIPNATSTTNTLEYRVSPTMTENVTIEIPALPVDDRANLAATALLNDLFTSKDLNKVLGSIVQNDPTSNLLVYSGIHLVAYTATNDITEFVVDIIDIPEDLEIALGNRLTPITTFSSKPRSITVKAYYEKTLAQASNLLTDAEGKALLVKAKPASIVQRMIDIRESQYKSYYPKDYYPQPPHVYDPHSYRTNKNRL